MSGLTDEQRTRFDEDGYVVVEDIIDPHRHLDPIVADYAGRLDELVRDLVDAGELDPPEPGLSFGATLTWLYQQTRRDWSQHFDFSLPLRGDVRADEPCFFSSAVFALLRTPALLDAIESLIGPEIYSNPVQHVRLKPPQSSMPAEFVGAKGLVGRTPWHQDASVVVEEADETDMVTVWLPVFDATVENGCLRVAPRSHRDGLLEHCPDPKGRYLSTSLFDAERAVPVPMRRGSALFMSKTTPRRGRLLEDRSVRREAAAQHGRTGAGRPQRLRHRAHDRRSCVRRRGT